MNYNLFKYYKYCFDTDQLSNLYNKFRAEQRAGNIVNSKEFIQLIFVDFISELNNVQINNEIKNKDYFFEELLQEIQKSVKLYKNIISYEEDKEFTDFVKQVITMSGWFLENIIEKYNSIDSVRKFETKLKLNTPSKYPNIFKNKVAEEFFNYAIKEMNVVSGNSVSNTRINAIFINEFCKDNIFIYGLKLIDYVDFINELYSVKINSSNLGTVSLQNKRTVEKLTKSYFE